MDIKNVPYPLGQQLELTCLEMDVGQYNGMVRGTNTSPRIMVGNWQKKMYLWFVLQIKVYKKGPKNLKDLQRFCVKEWSQIFCVSFKKHIEKTLWCLGWLGWLNTGLPIIVIHVVLVKNRY